MGFKLSQIFQQVRIGIAVGKVVAGGKHGKIFEKIEQGAEIAEQAKALGDFVKGILKK